MTFTITRFVSLGLSARTSKASLRLFPPASASPRCINIHPLSRPIKTPPTRRLYSTATVGTAKTFGSAVAVAVIAGGASLFLALARSRDTAPPNPTAEAVVEVIPTPPQTGSEPTHNFAKALEDLQAEFPEYSIVSTDPGELYAYAQSAYSQFVGLPHTIVVHVRSTEDVVKVVKIANKYLVPIVPYSGGTSLEGNLSASDADVVCQAGVTWNDLNETLREKGMSLCSRCGMISTGCSGTNAVKYGTARGEWILNATVVLPSGEVIKTRQRARKSSVGFDVTKLFIGAEGTLGIITEATLRLAPVLPSTVAVAQFPDIRHATDAVCDVLNHGAALRKSQALQRCQMLSGACLFPTECVEIIDELTIKALNQFGTSARKWPEKVTLFFKFQGSDDVIQETSRHVESAVAKHGATDYQLASNKQESEDIWQDRRNALFACLAYRPGCQGWITDVCVPVSRLPDLISAAKKDFEELGLIAPIAGHVGDGNFHALVLYADDAELALVREAVSRINHKAIELEGTCTGEHGVGTGKRNYLLTELGEGTVALMRTIKQTLDPHNLFNPGKLYPDVLPPSDTNALTEGHAISASSKS
ncbi:FAD-linked oxidase-like protein [Suillus subalutaceus]|uniref:FAD-linked oxidase-like protein n=1 Tax=Suillus subalutaceus TaxID=48586 RepID=UPI001B86B2ED|nr:FAD-linked oxidase-like protein [Suillus subalutaceus]KAG1838136.1 FAD-linked oxidase-like protein [Suillus subalutaceus]